MTVSTIALVLGSDGVILNIEAPPMPSSGFNITSPCKSMNLRISSALRVTVVGGISSGNFSIDSFSLLFLIALGLLRILAPCISASSNK